MHVCVLGAGVIGVASADRLLREGHEVTLVDAMPDAGLQASFGNGGQLSYSYVAPLADPSVWRKWPEYLFSAGSPLTLRPRLDAAQWLWLARFLAACTTGRARRTTAELLQLAFLSRSVMAEMRRELPFDFAHRTAGKLVMLSDEAALQAARRQVDYQAQFGCRQRVLDLEACWDIEPALVRAGARWRGGVYTEDEEVGDCAAFCRHLLGEMRRHPRFVFLPDTEVTAINVEAGKARSVSAAGKRLSADAFVLAMGVGSAALARRAGLRLPLYPLKGYSITLPLSRAALAFAPRVSVTDMVRKIVYAQLGDKLRVAGRIELLGMDRTVPMRALQELQHAVMHTFPGLPVPDDAAAWSPWAGFRPATPTGVPFIGPTRVVNLFLNTGHGALGWTLACGSAMLLAELIGKRRTSVDPAPFCLRS